jgi:adenosylcobinamide-GDP ribazoletransferase
VVSRIPVKAGFRFDPSRMDFYLPLTGICAALPGPLIFTVLSLLTGFVPSGLTALTAVLVLTAQYLGFNLFHLDGLMDTADAFWGTADREKRRDILKDSRIGVYGFFAGLANLSLKGILLCALLPFARRCPALVFAYPLYGRFSAALVPGVCGPANPGGLGAITRDSRVYRCAGGIVLALLIWGPLVWGLTRGVERLLSPAAAPPPPFFPGLTGVEALPALAVTALSLLVICPLTALYYARLYRKSLGGYTGDALGAAVETAELLCLAAALGGVIAFGR